MFTKRDYLKYRCLGASACWALPVLAVLCVSGLLAVEGCQPHDPRPPTPARQLDTEQLLVMPTPAHEHYYVLIFGSQGLLREPRLTHTWATAVRTMEQPGHPRRILAVDTISWMPATLDIKPGNLTPEPGVNLTLTETISEMLKQKEQICLWGPYEAWMGLYIRFLKQKEFIDSGKIGYQCIDQVGGAAQQANASNCFHAITDMDPKFGREEYPLILYGHAASENIVRQLYSRPVLIQPHKTHDWLIHAMGLDHYPITVRQYTGSAKEFSPEAVRAEGVEVKRTTQPASDAATQKASE